MSSLYNLILYLYFSLFRLAALFHPKAAAWWNLRRNWIAHLDTLSPGKKTIWIHVASAGEFEQAIPLIRRIRESGLDFQVAVSAYSQSGYEACQRSAMADACFPFPPDFKHNVNSIICKINPSLTVFIRNEIWLNTLKQLKDQLSPVILINAEQEERRGLYGLYLRHAFSYFTRICYAGETGHTKTERVLETAQEPFDDPVLQDFSRNARILVLGSCYDPEAEQLAAEYPGLLKRIPDLKLILCPHQWDARTVDRYRKVFNERVDRYSNGPSHARILFIDRMGILKYLYRYADVAYVGGGFGRGIHNVLEAAVYGIPVLIGPAHQRFPEVQPLIDSGQVTEIQKPAEMGKAIQSLLDQQDQSSLKANRQAAFNQENGASRKIWKIMETYIRH